MIELFLTVCLFCSSLGFGIAKTNEDVKSAIRKPRQHQEPLNIDREVIG